MNATDNPQAEEIIAKWLEFCNVWHKSEWPDDPTMLVDRDYVWAYHSTRSPLDVREPNDDFLMIVHIAVTDELGHATLLGIFEEDELIYATAEIDTSWREFYRKEFPTGLIDTSKPYTRQPEFLNTPKEVN